jgi:hypothetical protein
LDELGQPNAKEIDKSDYERIREQTLHGDKSAGASA